MPRARSGETETFWRNRGMDTPSLFLIHRTLAHSGAWSELAELPNRPAAAFDLPGHGQSGEWDSSTGYLDQCLCVAEDFLDGERMDVVGLSFGTVMGLRLAMEQPERGRRLAMI